MKLSTALSWNIKCPACGKENSFSTTHIYCNDNTLDLVFEAKCPCCGKEFGYIQGYVNDSDKDVVVTIDDLERYGYRE